MKRRAALARGSARLNGAVATIRVVDLNIILPEKTVLNER